MVENVKELLKLHEGLKREVYLDNENSTAVPKEVVDAMVPYFAQRAYGNPTLTHKPGWEAFETIMESSQNIAHYLGAKILEEITFTPGETEANNLALMGSAFANKSNGKKIVISEIEPINVLNVTEMLQKYGFTTTKIPVDHEGFLNTEKLKEAIDKETVLVSISAVNNEIGTVQPKKDAVDIVKDKNPSTSMTESDLVDVTLDLLQDPGTSGTDKELIKAQLKEKSGWYIKLDVNLGEKVLSPPVVFYKTAYFTTFTPTFGTETDPCFVGEGKARVYVLRYDTGNAALNLDLTNDVGGPIVRRSDRTGVIGTAMPSGVIITFMEGTAVAYAGVGGGVYTPTLPSTKSLIPINWKIVF